MDNPIMDFSKPEYLYRLARSGSAHDRMELATSLQDIVQTEHRQTAVDILLLLLKEAEQDLRIALATQLATQPHCPMELIQFLIYQNPFPVADPVLRLSPLLDNAELLKVLDHFAHDPAYAQAVAQRKMISAQIAARVLEQDNNETAYLLLLRNPGTQLNDICLDYLTDIAKKRPLLQQPFLQRKEVTPEIAAKLFWHVSVKLRQFILDQFPMSALKLDQLMDEAIQQRVNLKSGVFALTDQAKIKAERVQANGAITSRQPMEALRHGDVPLFTCLIALLTQTKPERVLDLLLQDTTETLAVIAHTLRLTRGDFNGLYLLWRRQAESHSVLHEKDIISAQDRFAMVTPHYAREAIAKWQHNND